MKASVRNEGRFDEVLKRVVPIFSNVDAELVFVACLDANDRVTEGEFFGSNEQPKNTLPVDELFHLARRSHAAGILVATRASGPFDELHDCDLSYARRVKEAGESAGVPVLGQFLIWRGRHRGLADGELGASA